MNNNKRIAQNTIYMYVRMGITMLVQLYTSRVILENLGVEDYGIYNVVGSFIVSFTFIQSPIAGAIQRFLNYELGKGRDGQVNVIMNLSLYIYIVLSIVLFVVIEIIGIWYINNKMILPADRLDATLFVFQVSLIGLVFSLIRSPYEALIIAHERMSYYAYISIIEVSLRLLNAFLLSYMVVDKLRLYAFNQLIIVLCIGLILIWYCFKKFRNEIILCRIKDGMKFKEILSFSGWSLFSGVASMTATHGINILLNIFFGVTVNAAMGIANQVNASVNQFSSNFQKAFNPQIVKLYASDDLLQMRKLVSRSSRFSYLLLFFIVCPVLFNIDFLLRIWLNNPPKGTGIFCIYLLIWQLLESLMAPMWTAITATGKIKRYHLTMNPIILSVIILSFFALKLGLPAYSVLLIKCIIDVLLLIVRLKFIQRMINFDIYLYVREVLIPIGKITFICTALMYFLSFVFVTEMNYLVFSSIIYLVVYFIFIFYMGMQKSERKKIVEYVLTVKKRGYEYFKNNKA